MELLILLAEKDGDVVSREEIVERLWGKDVFLDTEHGINTAIRKIRQALRDDPDNPRFLQTVTGKGYRFVGHQNGNQATPEPLPKSQTVEPSPSAPIPPTPIESQPWRPAVIAVLGLCVVGGDCWLSMPAQFVTTYSPEITRPRFIPLRFCLWPICRVILRRIISRPA
jgi:DNA-binding winged helix-turn-helix (wHTH) protein